MAEDWLNPLNRLVLYRAFKVKAAQCTLTNGPTLTLDYDKMPGKVYVRPVKTPAYPNEFVPCGYFDLDTVTREDWIA